MGDHEKLPNTLLKIEKEEEAENMKQKNIFRCFMICTWYTDIDTRKCKILVAKAVRV